jgi:hypothetical protein
MEYEEFVRRFSPLNLCAVLEYKDGRQNTLHWTGGDLVRWLESEHFHQLVVKGKTLTTPHQETLHRHSVLCAKACHDWAIEHNEDPVKYFIMGFLHDVGKPGTTCSVGKHLSMKGHGLVGASIVEYVGSPEVLFEFGLTASDWADIVLAVGNHMCGYHTRFSRDPDAVNMQCFSTLPVTVRRMLCALRVGDITAMVPWEVELHADNLRRLGETQAEFERGVLHRTVTGADLCHTQGLNTGVAIFVMGASGAGKTHTARDIIKKLRALGVERVEHVARDDHMVRISEKYMGVKDAGPTDAVEGKRYRAAYDFYVSNNKKWAQEINASMRNAIGKALFEHKVVIIDTMATQFAPVAKDIMPNEVFGALRFGVWCHRSNEFSTEEAESRRGMTPEENIRINKPRSRANPLGEGLWWADLVAVTEDVSPLFKTTRPHMAITRGQCDAGPDRDRNLDWLCQVVADAMVYFSSLPAPPTVEDTTDKTLLDMVRTLVNMGDTAPRGIAMAKDFFVRLAFTVKVNEYSDSHLGAFWTLTIKYMDGVNQLWLPLWAREARGRGYLVTPDRAVHEVKASLVRGAELLTAAHLSQGVSGTQDIDAGDCASERASDRNLERNLERFDAHQRSIMAMFDDADATIEQGFVTGKADGALCVATRYPKDCAVYPYMLCVAKAEGALCLDTPEGLWLLSTSGCLVVGDAMRDYVVTALAGHCACDIAPGASSRSVWDNVKYHVCDMFQNIARNNCVSTDDVVGFTFEMMCKGRVTHKGNLHTELAIEYDKSFIQIFGMCWDDAYVPHFRLEGEFPQPYWRKVSSTAEVFAMMRDLEDVVGGRVATDVYAAKWFPGQDSAKQLHAEGFVYLDYRFADPRYGPTYSKIKLGSYYICHNAEKYGKARVAELGDATAAYFPIVGRLQRFRENSKAGLTGLLRELCCVLRTNMEPGAATYDGLATKAKARVNASVQAPEDAKLRDTAFKIIVNAMHESLVDRVQTMCRSAFDIRDTRSDVDVSAFTKALLMKASPWKVQDSDLPSAVDALVATQTDLVGQLFRLCVF